MSAGPLEQLPPTHRQGNRVRGDGGELFDIRGLLGSGAMGAVYRAHDVAAGREVALKVNLATTQQLEGRMGREGQLTAALDHPGIVRIFSAGTVGGRPYLSYELVEGARTLESQLATLDRGRRLELLLEVADAMAHAHAKGIVHRDLKPENVLIDARGRARVADFGLARADWDELERLTQTGAWVGTPFFSAPEQVSAGKTASVSPATDVWALGVMLYEALTLTLPFESDNMLALAGDIVNGRFRPPRDVDPAVPAALEAVCLAALQPEPGLRYRDAGAFADDLRRALAGERTEASLRRRRRPAVGLALAAVAVGGGVLVALVAHAPQPAAADAAAGRDAATVRPARPPKPPPTAPPAVDPEVEWEAAVRLRDTVDRYLAIYRWLREHPASPHARERIGLLAAIGREPLVRGVHMRAPFPTRVAFRADGALLFGADGPGPAACRDRHGVELWSRSFSRGLRSGAETGVAPLGAGALFWSGSRTELWSWSGDALADARGWTVDAGRPLAVAIAPGRTASRSPRRRPRSSWSRWRRRRSSAA